MRFLQSLQTHLARQYVKLYPPNLFIGITGSVGRSTCVEAAAAVCSQKYKTITTNPYSDPVHNISHTLLRINPKTEKVILELEAEHKGEMDFYLSQVKPKIALFTKTTYMPGTESSIVGEILSEQQKLMESLGKQGVAIVNWDDLALKEIAGQCRGNVLFYGTDPKNCTVWAGNIGVENFGTSFELNSGVERVKINFKLLGINEVYAALAASLLGVVLGIPLTKIKPALESLESIPHCMQTLLGPNNSIILDDTNGTSPVEVEAAIDTLLAVPARRRIVVLGEMRDLGVNSEVMHREIARKIYKEKLDLVFLGQGETRFIAEELKSLGFWEEKMESDLQSSQLVSRLLKTLGKGDVCLIKGSKSVRLDEVVSRIAKKT
ncbi:MAG: UDP-N-acetylmuramoyl-tripeptide--D-alanyl-D-alanine ligase [Candidatus Daviesbacteria bacterium]|nr:UDP-N-acetylmuramoyl-tripeptide--D-alanyl-D-alanine ligase [Candidatus Daviesbacteria bacterium]